MVLTFGPSQSEHTIPISIINDPALENTESFTVRLSQLTGVGRVSFIEPQATVNILDNDGEREKSLKNLGVKVILNVYFFL